MKNSFWRAPSYTTRCGDTLSLGKGKGWENEFRANKVGQGKLDRVVNMKSRKPKNYFNN